MPKDRRARGLIAASCVLIATAGLGCGEQKPVIADAPAAGITVEPPKALPKGVKAGGQQKIMVQ
jgi:hypothetical protein